MSSNTIKDGAGYRANAGDQGSRRTFAPPGGLLVK
jgi:hypothetical protein